MALGKRKEDKFITVLGSDGSLRMVVPEGTEGSERREYETSDGKKGVKHELVFSDISGLITKLSLHDGEFGKSLHIEIKDGEEAPLILSLSTSQNFGEDFMKKLPNINLEKPVKIAPYAFENEKGKTIKGLTITQDGTKIKNYFFDEVAKKNINGIPNPKGDVSKYSKDKWKIYFLEVREFLVENTEEKFVKASVGTTDESKNVQSDYDSMTEDEITPDDVPM